MSDIPKHTFSPETGNSIADCFLKNVVAFSDKNALFINEKFYSYRELMDIVHSVFVQIPAEKKHDRIGIYCNNDVLTYASIIAVNLYGAAYVPLNNSFPIAKNKNIVEQCDLKLILTSEDIGQDLMEIAGEITVLNVSNLKNDKAVFEYKKENLNSIKFRTLNQPTAYILFTSGTTGDAKGVPVSFSNLNHFFDFFLSNYDFNSEDKFLQVYELTFDVSVFSFFMPLLVGACCYVVPSSGIKFKNIINEINKHKITVVSMVPTVLQFLEKYLKEITLPSLRYSFFSGDALQQSLASEWSKSLPSGEIHNFYGPTETTIVCTRYIWNKEQADRESVNGVVPIGKPFREMDFLIIDENNLQAEKGELCFNGTQVISNYLNHSNENSFISFDGKRYYKTGDIVSLNEAGNLVFYGRIDSQVKINGFRVELKEIEFAIEKITGKKAIVLCINDERKMNALIAFSEQTELDETTIKEKLLNMLPHFMIPKQIITVLNFPLNLNGKPDRNKLLTLQK